MGIWHHASADHFFTVGVQPDLQVNLGVRNKGADAHDPLQNLVLDQRIDGLAQGLACHAQGGRQFTFGRQPLAGMADIFGMRAQDLANLPVFANG
jgi:hypothetical protein